MSIFVNSYQHAKNQFFHLFILQILSVLESHHKNGHNHFLTMHNFFNRLLICMNLYQHAKTSYFNLFILEISQFQSPVTRLPEPILDHGQPKNFRSTFNFCQFVSTSKNEAISSICSRKIVDLKILQSDWLRAFWPIYQEQGFSHRIYAETKQIIQFRYKTNSVEINDLIFL